MEERPSSAGVSITSKARGSAGQPLVCSRWAIFIDQIWELWLLFLGGNSFWFFKHFTCWLEHVHWKEVKGHSFSSETKSPRRFCSTWVGTEGEPCVWLSVGSWPLLRAGCKDCELEARHLISFPPLCVPFPSKVMCCGSPWPKSHPPFFFLFWKNQ